MSHHYPILYRHQILFYINKGSHHQAKDGAYTQADVSKEFRTTCRVSHQPFEDHRKNCEQECGK
jgi:hypothetical protein